MIATAMPVSAHTGVPSKLRTGAALRMLAQCLLALLLVSLLSCCVVPVRGAASDVPLRQRLYPVSGVTAQVVSSLLREASSAYMVENDEIELSVVGMAASAAKPAFATGQYGYMMNTLPPTLTEQAASPYIKAYPGISNAVVLGYSLPASFGTAQLVLSPLTLCAILRANITNWNDPRIRATNPALTFSSWPIGVVQLTAAAGQTDVVKAMCGKIDPEFARDYPRSNLPTWPTSKYAAYFPVTTSDQTVSPIIDFPGTVAIAPLQNLRAAGCKMAALLNAQGVPVTPDVNTISLNILELATGALPAGETVYDLSLPRTPAAWPLCTMFWLVVDTRDPVSTCATKAATLKFLLWFYTSDTVQRIATAQSQVIMPDLYLQQTGILEKLQRDMLCQGEQLLSTTQQQSFIQGWSAVQSTLALYTTFFYAQASDYQYNFVRASDTLALQRLVVNELDLALVDQARLSEADVSLVQQAGAAAIPFALSGVAITFALPTSIAGPASRWTTDSTLPKLFPIVLDTETVAQIFVGNVTSFLDPQILRTAPQLQEWFAAYTSARPSFKVVTCCSAVAGASDPAVAGNMLLRGLQHTRTAALPQWAPFFAAARPDWTKQQAVGNSNFSVIESEARLSLRMAANTLASGTSSTISYRLVASASSDPLSEIQLIRRGQPISQGVEPAPANFAPCIADELERTAAESKDSSAVALGNVAYRSWVSGNEPGCYPLSAMITAVINLEYFGEACARGNYSLNFFLFSSTSPALSLAALNNGVLRAADLPAISSYVEQTLNTATCDGERLLITLPQVWAVNGAIRGFGLAVVAIGLAVIAASMGVVYHYRHRSVLRSSSAPFLGAILVGMALMISAIAPLVERVSEQSCGAFMWLASLGFTGMFLPFFAKTWRIYMIFNRRQLQVVKMSNRKLLGAIGVLVACELVLLLCWSQISPLQPVRYVKNIAGTFHQATHCSVRDGAGMTFVGIEAAYKGVLLVFGAVMAFGTRRVSSAFNEAQAIAWSVYMATFSSVIVGAIIYFVAAFEDALVLLLLFLLFWIVLVGWVLLFAVKFHALFTLTEEEAAIVSKVDSVQTERSAGGFSFVSVAMLPATMLKTYIAALEAQLVKARKQLTVVLGTTGAPLGIGHGVAAKPLRERASRNLSGGGGTSAGRYGPSTVAPMPPLPSDEQQLLDDTEGDEEAPLKSQGGGGGGNSSMPRFTFSAGGGSSPSGSPGTSGLHASAVQPTGVTSRSVFLSKNNGGTRSPTEAAKQVHNTQAAVVSPPQPVTRHTSQESSQSVASRARPHLLIQAESTQVLPHRESRSPTSESGSSLPAGSSFTAPVNVQPAQVPQRSPSAPASPHPHAVGGGTAVEMVRSPESPASPSVNLATTGNEEAARRDAVSTAARPSSRAIQAASSGVNV